MGGGARASSASMARRLWLEHDLVIAKFIVSVSLIFLAYIICSSYFSIFLLLCYLFVVTHINGTYCV